MNRRLGIMLSLGAALFAGVPAPAGSPQYVKGKSLTETVRTRKAAAVSGGKLQVPLITWGGDVATILADDHGLFDKAGLEIELFVENNFPKQVEAVLAGKTPYLRGTMGMINAAAETLKQAGVELVVVYQMTWSSGGDTMVVRSKIDKPKDLKGKTIALQLYGPHMDYLANVLTSAKVPLSKVELKWLTELTLPTYETGGKDVDPVSAFRSDKSIDAVMCISPDAALLSSGGAEGVKGAKVLLTTKTASRVIADVYAVRKDYFDANRGKVQSFVSSLLKAQEDLADLTKKGDGDPRYRALLSKSADLLLGASQATDDVAGLLADCEFVGFDGNVQFFTGKGTIRDLRSLNKEIQTAFRDMGLMSGTVSLASANWDYSEVAKGLRYATDVPAAKKPKFDTKRVERAIAERISVEPTTWAAEGTLFQVEIFFDPNQSEFTVDRYSDDFGEALKKAQTYAGALVVIEGHSDPLGLLKAKERREQTAVIAQMERQAKNLSLSRSRAVRDSFLKYSSKRGLKLDESQFVAVGRGVEDPKFNPPRTKEEWSQNRRVVFTVKQVEAELSEFVPLD